MQRMAISAKSMATESSVFFKHVAAVSRQQKQKSQEPTNPKARNQDLIFLFIPKEIRQRILFRLIDEDQLPNISHSSLHSLAEHYAKVHPVLIADMETILGDWIRRKGELAHHALVTKQMVELVVKNYRREFRKTVSSRTWWNEAFRSNETSTVEVSRSREMVHGISTRLNLRDYRARHAARQQERNETMRLDAQRRRHLLRRTRRL